MIQSLLFILLSSLSFHPELHEFHFGKFEIEHNEENSSLEVSMYLFLDDLEEGITKKEGIKDLNLCTDKETNEATQGMIDYISSNFLIYNNDEKLQMNFIGKELSDDLTAVWCYMEILLPNQIGEISISNSVLMELFEDQKNLVRFKSDKNGKIHKILDGSDYIMNLDL